MQIKWYQYIIIFPIILIIAILLCIILLPLQILATISEIITKIKNY